MSGETATLNTWYASRRTLGWISYLFYTTWAIVLESPTWGS